MNKLLADYQKKPIVPTGVVNGVMAVSQEEYSSTDDSDDDQFDTYEQEYVNQEMQRYAKYSSEAKCESMSEVEGVDGMDSKNNPLSVYSNYNFAQTIIKKELPIDFYKKQILQMIESNAVVIIQGPTGCGKTTQAPQFILDQCKERKEFCNIAVTQPRKIAAITVARRVCQERGWTLGTLCGYQVGLEKKIHPDMLLNYMTTGVLLQKLIRAKSLHQFSHIIIDEIHERNQELDFLLLLVRRFLFTNSPMTKVILMSATIEAEEFAYYFRSQTYSSPIPAPITYVKHKGSYKNTIFYLENLSNLSNATHSFDVDKPEIGENMWNLFVLLVSVTDRVDETDLSTGKRIIGSILVFLPGLHEIEEAHKRLVNYRSNEEIEKRSEAKKGDDGKPAEQKIKWQIIPLHSSLPNYEQAEVFKPAKEGHRKIILSTNIAESSITVPDTYYVIDFCQTKVMTVDPVTKFLNLRLEWASHVNCEQRAGRVGRVSNGRVYRLISRGFYMEKMSDRSMPEILRAPLERVVLQAKMLNLNDTPQQILALSMNPPNIKNIEMTILNLKECGGLLQTCRGTSSSSDGDITFMGTIMAALPIDVRLAKLVVLGHLFGCLEEAIIMAAGCSIQNIFSIPYQQKFNAYKKLLLWANHTQSDLIALFFLYKTWQSKKRDNQLHRTHEELSWCKMNLVSLKGLKEWNLLVIEIYQRLEFMNIKNIPGQIPWKSTQDPGLILKVIIAGAFYPNFFIREPDPDQQNEKEAVKAVGGRDPFRTVYLTGLDHSQPGPIYISALKEMFKNEREPLKDMAVGFDGSSKIYIEFNEFEKNKEHVTVSIGGQQMVTELVREKISREVYMAVRKRQLRYPFSLKVLPIKDAWKFAEKHGIERKSTLQTLRATAGLISGDRNCYTKDENYSPIPSLDMEWITLKITEFVDASHFWINVRESEEHLARMEKILNRTVLHGVLASGQAVSLGQVYAAKFHEDNVFYRCRVMQMKENTLQIKFIDYGNNQQINLSDLCILPDFPELKVPAMGVECVLQGVQPARKINPKCVWTEEVNRHWQNHLCGFLLFGKIHSVVDDVIYLDLYKQDPSNRTIKSINEQMLLLGHADKAEPSYRSKSDNDKRQKVINAVNPPLEAALLSFDKVENYSHCVAPTFGSKYDVVQLKGPFSPLEIKLYGCIESASSKSVDIEGSSVNSVLLDSDPQGYHTSLLVAGYVSQTTFGNKLKLRSTTLMPNIPGLPTLLALMFCPTMRAKVTDDGTRVASILCGLGYNLYTRKPYFPSHDLVMTLDTELTEEEINDINKIRFYMNQGVKLIGDITNQTSSQEDLVKIRNALITDVLKLIKKEDRKPVPRASVSYSNVWAKNNVEALVLKPNTCDDSGEEIWPLLWFIKLKNIPNFNPDISNNLNDLDLVAREMKTVEQIECYLCQELLYTFYDVRYHLISDRHKQLVEEYYDLLNADEED